MKTYYKILINGEIKMTDIISAETSKTLKALIAEYSDKGFRVVGDAHSGNNFGVVMMNDEFVAIAIMVVFDRNER